MLNNRRSRNYSSKQRFHSQRKYNRRVSLKDGFRKSKRHLKYPPEISNVTVQNIDKQSDDLEHGRESVPVAHKSNTLNAYNATQLLSCVHKYGGEFDIIADTGCFTFYYNGNAYICEYFLIDKLSHSIILGNQEMDSRCANIHYPTATLPLDSVTLLVSFFKNTVLPSAPTKMYEVPAAEDLLVPSESHVIVFAKLKFQSQNNSHKQPNFVQGTQLFT